MMMMEGVEGVEVAVNADLTHEETILTRQVELLEVFLDKSTALMRHSEQRAHRLLQTKMLCHYLMKDVDCYGKELRSWRLRCQEQVSLYPVPF
jgi:hypothetical protein